METSIESGADLKPFMGAGQQTSFELVPSALYFPKVTEIISEAPDNGRKWARGHLRLMTTPLKRVLGDPAVSFYAFVGLFVAIPFIVDWAEPLLRNKP